MLIFTTNIMIDDVFVVMNMTKRTPNPNASHYDSPYQEEDKKDCRADKELVGDVVFG